MTYDFTTRATFYNGQSHTSDPATAEVFESINPANGRSIAEIHTSSHTDIDNAISSAKAAFASWSQTTPLYRARILQKAVSLLRSRNDQLARVETLDTGKPLSETRTVDVVTGADVLEYYANLIASGGLDGTTTQLRTDASFTTTRCPLGVCAAIGAWNYPLQIALWKSAPCLAAGNCMVYKPSEVTSLHAQLLAEIYIEAGVPPGVFNVVYGGAAVGAYLTTNNDIAKVSFTGQVATGKKVAAAAAGEMKYVTMELGGKSPLIIMQDCKMDRAVDGAMMANFFSTGQVCTNGTRVFVPKSRLQEFEHVLAQKMKHIRPGDVLDPDTNFGPLVSAVHYGKVRGYIRHGIDVDGARLIHGGLDKPAISHAGFENGFWVAPTVLTDCTDTMKITTEEIFGPVMCLLPYDTLDEAIARANNTRLGLAAGVFCEDLQLAKSVVARLEAGITWINTWGESPAEMPVGGWKLSGIGVENGKEGLLAWTRNKSTLIDTSGEVASVFSKL